MWCTKTLVRTGDGQASIRRNQLSGNECECVCERVGEHSLVGGGHGRSLALVHERTFVSDHDEGAGEMKGCSKRRKDRLVCTCVQVRIRFIGVDRVRDTCPG